MNVITRREHMKALLGFAAAPYLPQSIPPQGVARGIRHLSYSDIGGRPDSVQVMVNRRHAYVGHMFGNGVTILDATDPRRLKPVGFFTGGDFTRTHHMQVAEDMLLLANGANIVAMQSYDNMRGYFENNLADSITNRKKFRSGLSIHDIADPAAPKLLAHINWSPPFPGGTHTALPLPGRNLVVVADEANAEKCAKGTFHTFIVDVRAPENPVPVATLPTPKDRDFCGLGVFGPHNLHENRPGSYRSEEKIFATYNNAGVRVFDIKDAFAPKEVAYWVPPIPRKLIDPRPNVSLAAKSADVYVTTEGLMYVTDWNAGLNVLQYEG